MIRFVPGDINKDGEFSYTADGENISASCTAKLQGARLDILSVDYAGHDAFIIEGLIRSVLNYGANRNAFTAYAKPEDFGEQVISILSLLGFETENGVLVCDIPDALTGSCCHCK